MFTTLRNVALCLTALFTLNGSTLAEDYVPTLRPVEPIRLGFVGHLDHGHGMHVERVLWGSIADQIGLEAGDLIVRINGQRISCDGDYFDALRHAGGVFEIVVRDVRSGHYNTLRFRVFGGRVRFDEECDHHHHGDHDVMYLRSRSEVAPARLPEVRSPGVRVGVGGSDLSLQIGRFRISSHP